MPWTAPIVSDANAYAGEVVAALAAAGIRAEADLRNEKINYKVREHSLAKVPVILAVGAREVAERSVSVRRLGDAGSRVEVRLKVVDLNKMLRDLLGSGAGLGSLGVVLAHRAYLFCFGSRTSRIPSPNRLKPRTVTRMNMPEIVAM